MSGAPATLLGFDYGEKRIGVAVGQTVTRTATALTTIAARDGQPDWDAISRLIEAWQPDGIVVGLPLNMDGTEQEMTIRARRFGRQLKERYRLDVQFADERLSTREARYQEGSDEAAEGRDAVAAKIIIEGWLAGARLDP